MLSCKLRPARPPLNKLEALVLQAGAGDGRVPGARLVASAAGVQMVHALQQQYSGAATNIQCGRRQPNKLKLKL